MSFFRVAPNALLKECGELEGAYHELCRELSELGGVIRRLESMTGFDGPISALRHVQRDGSDQQVKLRQDARSLEQIADLYIRTEQKNISDSDSVLGEASHIGSLAFAFEPGTVKAPSYPVRPLWTPWEMLAAPEELFGVPVVVQKKI